MRNHKAQVWKRNTPRQAAKTVKRSVNAVLMRTYLSRCHMCIMLCSEHAHALVLHNLQHKATIYTRMHHTHKRTHTLTSVLLQELLLRLQHKLTIYIQSLKKRTYKHEHTHSPVCFCRNSSSGCSTNSQYTYNRSKSAHTNTNTHTGVLLQELLLRLQHKLTIYIQSLKKRTQTHTHTHQCAPAGTPPQAAAQTRLQTRPPAHALHPVGLLAWEGALPLGARGGLLQAWGA